MEFGHLLEPFHRCSDQTSVVDKSAGGAEGDEAAGKVLLLEAAPKEEEDPAVKADREAILMVLTGDLWSTDKKELPKALAEARRVLSTAPE